MEENVLLYKSNKKRRADNFKKIIIIILITLAVVQQMPIIKDLFYSQIRILLYVGFGLISLYSLFPLKYILYHTFQRLFIITIIYSIILSIITFIFSDHVFNVFELIIPFGILIASYKNKFTERQISVVLIFYLILSVILGISSVFYYGQGFNIPEVYFLSGKNAIGPLIGIATIIILIWIFKKNQFKVQFPFIFKLLIFILLITSIIVIRNRASLIGIIVILLFLIINIRFKLNYRNIFSILFILIIVTISSFSGLSNIIIDIIIGSFTSTHEVDNLDGISAGRTSVYLESLKFILENPLLGELGTTQSIQSTPHNYIINKWVNYGIVGAFPLVALYLYLCFLSIVNLIRAKKNNKNFTLPLWVLMFSLIVSLFEYTYPYGPGVSQIMLWFLLGQYFRNSIKE